MINFPHGRLWREVNQHFTDHPISSVPEVFEQLIWGINPGQPEEHHWRPSLCCFGNIWTCCLVGCLRRWQISLFPVIFVSPLILEDSLTFPVIITLPCKRFKPANSLFLQSFLSVFMDLICRKLQCLEPLGKLPSLTEQCIFSPSGTHTTTQVVHSWACS